MKGFSEKGAPQDWDTAVGSVRGFRWWRVSVSLRKHTPSGALRYYPTRVNPLGSERVWNPNMERPVHHTMSYETIQPWQQWVPEAGYSYVQGFYNGSWAKQEIGPDKRYQARCAKLDSVWDTREFRPHSSGVPDPNCGCGFWAYWNTLDQNEWHTAIMPHVTRQGREMQLIVPIAGMIEGSGRVIIGEKGFRCEYARITDLALKVQGPCQYTNCDEQLQQRLYFDITHPTAITPAVPIYPLTKGEFLPFAAAETGLSMDQIYAAIVTAVAHNLGDNYKSWATVENLMYGAKRDENYA